MALFKKTKDKRADGYKNMLNKYGTSEDVSSNYEFEGDSPVPDIELTVNYEDNGLFAKIIDIPADDALRSGAEYGVNDKDIETFINKSLGELKWKRQAATAIKWSRLYGGAIIVMIIDDGRMINEPVDWDNITGIEELLVFERPLITPDYNSIYDHNPKNGRHSKFGKPEYYDVSPRWGRQFRVHESRCLLVKNGTMPQSSSSMNYAFFGIPEYKRIHSELQQTVTSHGNGTKLLDRAVQAIYKMHDLASLLETEEGEDIVLRRLSIIDKAKGIINSIAIDADGEDYDYKTVTFSGVKDIMDATCNMLSAVTNIPQTKLFGRSPAGENATGEGDMENYYSYVKNIQELNLYDNLGVLIDIILIVGKYKGQFETIPDYDLEFKELGVPSEKEKADTDAVKASAELTKAQTAQAYVDMQALDPKEVRKKLAQSGEFTVNDILDEEEDWNALEDQLPVNPNESNETSDTALSAENKEDQQDGISDEEITPTGCGVIVIKDGMILIGERKDNGLVCGPGGHIEMGETPEDAAIRETREEFGINIAETIPLTIISGMPSGYCNSQVFLCTEFYGTPLAFNTEMENARFEPVTEVLKYDLFLPFELSIRELLNQLSQMQLTSIESQSNISMEEDGGPGSGRKPEGGSKEDEPKGERERSKDPDKKGQTGHSGESSEGGTSEKSSKVSATGANEFKVKGFKNSQALNNHWSSKQGGHEEEYAPDGITTKKQYEERALSLVQSPVGGSIVGYKTSDGVVCRYDKGKNDYVKGKPDKGVYTMFKPADGEEYFNRLLKAEGVTTDE